MALRLDYCVHCACMTDLVGYTRERAIIELTDGDLGCENCIDQQSEGDFDGHTACVVLFEDGVKVFDNRCTLPRRKGA